MQILKDQTLCCGCSACAAACPKTAITMAQDSEGFRYPVIDPALCVDCGLCQCSCPIKAKQEHTDSDQEVLGAICRDDSIRKESSSGGVFSLLANHILQQGGVVFGATMKEDFTVAHTAVTDPDNLLCLRGSKYVQSDLSNTFRQAKGFLKEGRLVLYTGTPCQIAGLHSFLGKEYPNLICQDLICHGAPSPAVWKQYVQYRQEMAQAKAIRIFFRDKSDGWRNFNMRFDFENGTCYKTPSSKDPYMKAFLSDLSLRPSCYACSFKGTARIADITLADFWGVQDIHPGKFDNLGTSLVFLNTQKGKDLFYTIEDQLSTFIANKDAALSWNSAMIQSVKKPKQRDLFMAEIHNGDFAAVTQRHIPKIPLHKKAIQKAKGFLKKIIKKS